MEKIKIAEFANNNNPAEVGYLDLDGLPSVFEFSIGYCLEETFFSSFADARFVFCFVFCALRFISEPTYSPPKNYTE